MFEAYLSIGGNLGDRLSNISKCLVLIEEYIGAIRLKSSVYETQAWGNENQPSFLNMAVLVLTDLGPVNLLTQIHKIEKELGRERLAHWAARTIDIDILFFDGIIMETEELKIPHPYIQERMFVLEPLHEITSKYIHPILGKSVQELYTECNDKLSVRKLNDKI